MDFRNRIQIDPRLQKLSWYFDSTHDSKKLPRMLIQINTWLKKVCGILIRINSLLNESNQLFISLTFLGVSLSFVDLFGLSLKFVDLFGHSTKVPWFESAHDSSSISTTESIQLMTQAVSRRLNRFNSWLEQLSRNWLRINSWLKWIPQALIQIASRLKVLLHFSIQINSWLKRKTFYFDS